MNGYRLILLVNETNHCDDCSGRFLANQPSIVWSSVYISYEDVGFVRRTSNLTNMAKQRVSLSARGWRCPGRTPLILAYHGGVVGTFDRIFMGLAAFRRCGSPNLQ